VSCPFAGLGLDLTSGARYRAGAMRAAKQQKRASRPPRANPFACAGWRRFVTRAIVADQMAARAVRVRTNAEGVTLH
jgi:hypothetical protein